MDSQFYAGHDAMQMQDAIKEVHSNLTLDNDAWIIK